MKRILMTFCLPLILIASGPIGCQPKHVVSIEEQLTSAPDPNSILSADALTQEALKVTGGNQAWSDTKKFTLNAVVTFYLPDSTFYLTEQRYDVYPWSGGMRISATEPEGKAAALLTKQGLQFETGRSDANSCINRPFAEAMCNILTASVRLADEYMLPAPAEQTVKIEGRVLQPIELNYLPPPPEGTKDAEKLPAPELYWQKVVFYKQPQSGLIDTILLSNAPDQRSLLVRGYNYRHLSPEGIIIPQKVEIFKTNESISSLQRLAKIEILGL